MPPVRSALPVDAILAEVRARLAESGAAVVTAPPGSGKTTRIPPALLDDGPVLLVQPRRVAARGVARRIAAERGVAVGEEVGWQVRFERRFSKRTRLLVVTEGILLARLQQDPLLSEFRTLVLDEVHERSAQGDLAFALARQVREAREDFRVVAMSATLDTPLFADALGGCPVIAVDVPVHPVEVRHRDGIEPARAIEEAYAAGEGHLLAFLPGMGEIEKTARALSGRVPGARLHRLHGALRAEEQDAALASSRARKIILATNVAETSLTIDGVTTVVDSGFHRVLRRDRRIGLDRLATERIPQDSAEQRAGRAGRTGPGCAIRLWDPAQQLRSAREPEVHRIGLEGLLLEIFAWSEHPRDFRWLERPSEDALDDGLALLDALGATEDGRLTVLGERMRRLPLEPRLARIWLEIGGGRRAAEVCACLSEGMPRERGEAATTASDVLSHVADFGHAPKARQRVAARLQQLDTLLESPRADEPSDEELRRALLAGFPDRLARRRAPGSDRMQLVSGHGARLAPESGVHEGEWLLAIETRAADHGRGSEARVTVASRVEPEWLPVGASAVEHELDQSGRRVRARRRRRLGRLLLAEEPCAVDPAAALPLLREAFSARKPTESEQRVGARAAVAGVPLDPIALVEPLLSGATELPQVDLLSLLPFEERRALEEFAPDALAVPSGRRHRLEYREDGEVLLSVKLQELFGLAESPRIGRPQRPILLALLAPSGRPVQQTRDLHSFWQNTYPEVRRELRGRYPKHPWPEDPWTAPATHRTRRRPRG